MLWMRQKWWQITGSGRLKSKQVLERLCLLSKLPELYMLYVCAPHNPCE
jgi:hypothetical protein